MSQKARFPIHTDIYNCSLKCFVSLIKFSKMLASKVCAQDLPKHGQNSSSDFTLTLSPSIYPFYPYADQFMLLSKVTTCDLDYQDYKRIFLLKILKKLTNGNMVFTYFLFLWITCVLV